MRVLIVEDEPLIAEDLEVMVGRAGHQVCGKARSAPAARLLAMAELPDVVFMDVRIAGSQDGVDTAEQILEIHKCDIVFISAYTDDATRARIRRVVPDAEVLAKPVVWKEIDAACGRALAH